MITNLFKIIGQFFRTKEQFLQRLIPIPHQGALNASNAQFVCQWSPGRFPLVRLHCGASQFEVRSQIPKHFVLCVCMRARVCLWCCDFMQMGERFVHTCAHPYMQRFVGVL